MRALSLVDRWRFGPLMQPVLSGTTQRHGASGHLLRNGTLGTSGQGDDWCVGDGVLWDDGERIDFSLITAAA
jgi:hypothetical protein